MSSFLSERDGKVKDNFTTLFLLLGLDEPETLEAAFAAYLSPKSEVFAVDVVTLSPFLKLLTSSAPPESRSLIEAAFLDVLSSVRGDARFT